MKVRRYTTKEDFKNFKASVEKYIKFFGLIDWNCMFTHDKDSGMANVYVDLQAHFAHFSLCRDWSTQVAVPTQDEIDATAFHEVMELLLSDIRGIGLDIQLGHSVKRDALEVEAHRIIHRFGETVYKLIRENYDNTNLPRAAADSVKTCKPRLQRKSTDN